MSKTKHEAFKFRSQHHDHMLFIWHVGLVLFELLQLVYIILANYYEVSYNTR